MYWEMFLHAISMYGDSEILTSAQRRGFNQKRAFVCSNAAFEEGTQLQSSLLSLLVPVSSLPVFVAIAAALVNALWLCPAQAQGSTPTPWPIPEVPGVVDIEVSVSRFDMNIGTKIYIIEGQTTEGTPFICAAYVQYDVDQLDCQFPSLNQHQAFIPLAGQ